MTFRSQCKKQLHIIEVKCDVTEVYFFAKVCTARHSRNNENSKRQKCQSWHWKSYKLYMNHKQSVGWISNRPIIFPPWLKMHLTYMVITKANTVQETDKIKCKENTTTFLWLLKSVHLKKNSCTNLVSFKIVVLLIQVKTKSTTILKDMRFAQLSFKMNGL